MFSTLISLLINPTIPYDFLHSLSVSFLSHFPAFPVFPFPKQGDKKEHSLYLTSPPLSPISLLPPCLVTLSCSPPCPWCERGFCGSVASRGFPFPPMPSPITPLPSTPQLPLLPSPLSPSSSWPPPGLGVKLCCYVMLTVFALILDISADLQSE